MSNELFDIERIGLSQCELLIIDELLHCTDEVYVVGGAIRDILMGIKPKDFDVATDLDPLKVIDIFGGKLAKETGNIFPTVRVKVCGCEIEVSSFRSEHRSGVIGDRNAFCVQFTPDIKEDLMRRDLTINALAIHAKSGKLIDSVGGRKDIKSRTIKFVKDPYYRIEEDPLRYLRAVRFRTVFNGNYDKHTEQALKNANIIELVLKHVTKERIQDELIKGVTKSDKFSTFFIDLFRFGILEDLFPEIYDLIDHDGGSHHAEDLFNHSMMTGDLYGKVDPTNKFDILAKLASYLHDVGKVPTYDKKERTFYSHDIIGSKMVADILKRYRFSIHDTEFVEKMISNHMRRPTTEQGARRMYRDLGDSYKYLLKMFRADSLSNLRKSDDDRNKDEWYFSELEAMLSSARDDSSSFLKLAINGNDLMKEFNIKQGIVIGQMLSFSKDLVVDDPGLNRKDILINQIREIFIKIS